ncbi:uncharacterized protein LOC116225212 isoform X2 [Clupea harengus]|uniref:Uncharacterized protein LOC116225212 isoform X2 n=1 Tax=Clupea harengus TaxID=7950 RepID=A0A8M1KVN6_CLUHA|nr:uncharacterized protein LOC116225212 isoform X2 [Clupea harengus]
MRGFFACVNATSDSCFMHPFKPSSHHVESFIVAQAEPDIVSKPVMENSVLVSGRESINLACAFKTKGNYSNNPFVVYWIKTGAQSSTCVYSFDYDGYDSGADHHCAIDKDLLLRRSNTSKLSLDDNIHNLKISNATQSDRGQYLCVLMVNTNSQQYWAVITNTTVIMDNPDSHLIYVIGVLVPVLLLLPVIIIIIILLKRKPAETTDFRTGRKWMTTTVPLMRWARESRNQRTHSFS